MILREFGFTTKKIFEMVGPVLHTFLSRASLDSDGGVRVFASKFFDCFPGKMVLFADMLVGKSINLAIDEVNLRVKISIIKIFLGLNQRDVVE